MLFPCKLYNVECVGGVVVEYLGAVDGEYGQDGHDPQPVQVLQPSRRARSVHGNRRLVLAHFVAISSSFSSGKPK
jgi:hypothetical protein